MNRSLLVLPSLLFFAGFGLVWGGAGFMAAAGVFLAVWGNTAYVELARKIRGE